MRLRFWQRKSAAKEGIVRGADGQYTSTRIDGATGLPLYSWSAIRALERQILTGRGRRRRRGGAR